MSAINAGLTIHHSSLSIHSTVIPAPSSRVTANTWALFTFSSYISYLGKKKYVRYLQEFIQVACVMSCSLDGLKPPYHSVGESAADLN